MNEITIQRHRFEREKRGIQRFSEQIQKDVGFKRINQDKDLGEFWGDFFLGRGIGFEHQVTGKELNELTGQVQEHFISIYQSHEKVVEMFGSVYRALESLDKDYIQAILISIKATEETSEGIKATQEQIKKIVESQRKTLEELKKFKLKLDGYSHLEEIDTIWKDIQQWHEEIPKFSNELNAIEMNIGKNESRIEEIKSDLTVANEKIETMLSFITNIEKLVHLKDIDELWEQGEKHQNRITLVEQNSVVYEDKLGELVEKSDKMSARIDENALEINELKDYKETLDSISHLQDVDSIWQSVEGHGAQLIEGSKRDEELAADIQKNRDEVNQRISETVQATNLDIEALTRKVTYSYWIAGGAAGLAIIELILLLAQVI